MFEVNEIAEMTLQGQKSKSLNKKNKNNMNLRHHLTCRFAAVKTTPQDLPSLKADFCLYALFINAIWEGEETYNHLSTKCY